VPTVVYSRIHRLQSYRHSGHERHVIALLLMGKLHEDVSHSRLLSLAGAISRRCPRRFLRWVPSRLGS